MSKDLAIAFSTVTSSESIYQIETENTVYRVILRNDSFYILMKLENLIKEQVLLLCSSFTY